MTTMAVESPVITQRRKKVKLTLVILLMIGLAVALFTPYTWHDTLSFYAACFVWGALMLWFTLGLIIIKEAVIDTPNDNH